MEEVEFSRIFFFWGVGRGGNKIPQRQNQIAKPMSAKAFEALQNIITC